MISSLAMLQARSEAEHVLTPDSTVTLPTNKPRKQVWWHDGHWWVLGGWYAYRRDGPGDWVRAGSQLVGQNSRRLDVVVDPDDGAVYWYGWRSTGDDHLIGRASYDPATKTYRDAVRHGVGKATRHCRTGAAPAKGITGTLDSQGRYSVVGDDPGVTRYMVFDPTVFIILQGLTVLDDDVWTNEHQSRIVAFTDDEGPAVGVIVDDQVANECDSGCIAILTRSTRLDVRGRRRQRRRRPR